jgi:hypothetical protein
MKYALEALIVTLFCLLAYLIYIDNKTHEDAQYDAKMEQLSKRFDSLQSVADSVTIIENNVTKKITIINNYYDSSKISILSLSDSSQFILLFSNIKRFNYLLESKAGQSN